VFVNGAAARAFQRKRDELIGASDAEVFSPATAEQFERHDQQVIATRTGIEVVETLEHEDGVHYSLVNKFPIPGENGAPPLVGGMAIDITQRKVAEEALRDSERRKAAILESALDCLVTMDHEGRVVDFNPAAERTFGYRRDEAIGRTVAELIIPPRFHRAHWDGLRRYLATGEATLLGRRIEMPAMKADGSEINVELAISTVRAESGPPFFTANLRDITERQQADQALAESEAKFRDMADNIAQLAWMADSEGSIFWYNRRWFEYTGTTLEQMQGWGWTAVHHPEHVERVVEKVAWHWKSGKVWEDTFPLRGADGNYRWFLSRAQPICDETGKVVRWFGTNTDITAQLAAEEALREADRRKDEFLATLAHELRNPLAPICNGLELMAVAAGDPELIREVRATMERQARQMVRLVDDLLDVSRITRGKVELRTARVELRSIIDSAVESARPMIEEWEHALSISLPEQPVVLEADATRLAQVFSNLLNNAAKYMKTRGKIELAASASVGRDSTDKSVRPTADEVEISIKDTGIGIPPDMLDRIFDLFTQVDRSLERSHSGLGIGLTLVKRLVEMHGGAVEARSAGPDQGSEFIVRLPLVAGRVDEDQTFGGDGQSRSPGLRVLVVDDNESAAGVLSLLLKSLGNDVRTASDGWQALELAASFRPDIVLLDLGMPGLNGYETASRIRAEPWGKGMTRVALTGWGQEEDKRRTRAAGFDHHFVKPIEPEALQNLLAERRPRT
jgi:PAS domain S-box-containing protein